MSEEKKKEVLDQEKNLDESEMEEVSGGRTICFAAGGREKDGSVCSCPTAGMGEGGCICIVVGSN